MNGDAIISKGSARPSASMARGSRITALPPDGKRSVFDRLVGALQKKHSWNRERAAKELLRRIAQRQTSPDKNDRD